MPIRMGLRSRKRPHRTPRVVPAKRVSMPAFLGHPRRTGDAVVAGGGGQLAHAQRVDVEVPPLAVGHRPQRRAELVVEVVQDLGQIDPVLEHDLEHFGEVVDVLLERRAVVLDQAAEISGHRVQIRQDPVELAGVAGEGLAHARERRQEPLELFALAGRRRGDRCDVVDQRAELRALARERAEEGGGVREHGVDVVLVVGEAHDERLRDRVQVRSVEPRQQRLEVVEHLVEIQRSLGLLERDPFVLLEVRRLALAGVEVHDAQADQVPVPHLDRRRSRQLDALVDGQLDDGQPFLDLRSFDLADRDAGERDRVRLEEAGDVVEHGGDRVPGAEG